jgi:hypothetical protein
MRLGRRRASAAGMQLTHAAKATATFGHGSCNAVFPTCCPLALALVRRRPENCVDGRGLYRDPGNEPCPRTMRPRSAYARSWRCTVYRYVGDPTIFAVGDPTIFQAGWAYWMHKWLPDPPPDARDAILLSHIYALATMLSDAEDREELQRPISTLLTKRLG